MERKTGLWIGVGCLGLILVIILLAFAGIFALNRFLLPVTGGREGNQPYESQVLTQPVQSTQNQPAQTQTAQEAQQEAGFLNALYQQANPGVVSIEVQANRGGMAGFAAGSGFIVDNQGHIVTNHHVIEGAEVVEVVYFNEVIASAEVVASDPNSDLAVIKVDKLIPEAHPLPLGDSNHVVVGQSVVALGNPFNLANTMTSGIVSAVGRLIPSGFTEYEIPKAIQTDAAINPGNSGGPLLNMQGEVVGVNAQIQTGGSSQGNVGIGFAIPVNIVKLVVPALIEKGAYEWPYLGVRGDSLTPTIAEANGLDSSTRGAYIYQVTPGGPADKAGLQGATSEQDANGLTIPTGMDIIIAANGQPVNSFGDLLNIVAFSKPGDKLSLTILRDGKQIDVVVTLEPRPASSPDIQQNPLLPPGHPTPSP